MNEKLKELLKIMEENPELEVIFWNENEQSEDWGGQYCRSRIARIEKSIFCDCYKDGHVYSSEDELRDDIYDDLSTEEEYKDMDDEEFEKVVDEIYNEYEEKSTEVINVFLDIT